MIPTENLRFRDESLHFKIADSAEDLMIESSRSYQYPAMTKTQGNFKLHVEAGNFTDSEIIVMLGENGTGKTTFVRLVADKIKPDEPNLSLPYNPERVSLKPQTIAPKFPGTVRMLLIKQIKEMFLHPQFIADVIKPLNVEALMDQAVTTLSGGELQRVALILALGKPRTDIFLIDEPSAYLDSEQRIVTSKIIKRYIMTVKKTAFIVEHDFVSDVWCHCTP